MHEHDLDLIAALAEGSLADDSQARALVEACAECRAEYEGQVAVLEMLSSAPPVRLTDQERADLRRAAWSVVARPPARAHSPWWQRLVYATAALFLVVGIGAVLGNLGMGGQSGEDFVEVSSDLDRTAADEEAADDAADGAMSPQAGTETTSAAAETLADDSLATLAELTRSRLAAQDTEEPLSLPEGLEECLESVQLTDQVFVEAVERDGETFWVTAPQGHDSESPLTFIAAGSCQVVYIDE